MQWRNSHNRYGHLAVILHWTVAFTVYGMFGLGLWMLSLGYYDIWYHKGPELHKSIGIILFLAVLVRLIWRFISPPPPALKLHSPAVRLASNGVHILLYLLLFGILISGYLISTANDNPIRVFGFFNVPALFSGGAEQADVAGRIHLWLAWTLVVLSALHALAAIKHHFIDKDGTLKRMLGKPAD